MRGIGIPRRHLRRLLRYKTPLGETEKDLFFYCKFSAGASPAAPTLPALLTAIHPRLFSPEADPPCHHLVSTAASLLPSMVGQQPPYCASVLTPTFNRPCPPSLLLFSSHSYSSHAASGMRKRAKRCSQGDFFTFADMNLKSIVSGEGVRHLCTCSESSTRNRCMIDKAQRQSTPL